MESRPKLPPGDEPDPDPAELSEDALSDERLSRVASRPDGYYWVAPDGHQEFGPFESLEAALADMESGDEEGIEPDETLAEAEQELGIADWIDPETGAPAEDTGLRLEDH